MKFLITYIYPADKFLPVVKAWGGLTPQERASRSLPITTPDPRADGTPRAATRRG
jgi:hypothetical protein